MSTIKILNSNEIKIGETDILSGDELRIALRNKLDAGLDAVPNDTEQMTYEHAFLLLDIDDDGFDLQVVGGQIVSPDDIISYDGDTEGNVTVVLKKTNYKDGAIHFLDMDSTNGVFPQIPYAVGERLSKVLLDCGASVNAQTVNKGMTYQDVVNILEKKYKIKLRGKILRDQKTKVEVQLNNFIDPKRALGEAPIILVIVDAIEGNE